MEPIVIDWRGIPAPHGLGPVPYWTRDLITALCIEAAGAKSGTGAIVCPLCDGVMKFALIPHGDEVCGKRFMKNWLYWGCVRCGEHCYNTGLSADLRAYFADISNLDQRLQKNVAFDKRGWTADAIIEHGRRMIDKAVRLHAKNARAHKKGESRIRRKLARMQVGGRERFAVLAALLDPSQRRYCFAPPAEALSPQELHDVPIRGRSHAH